MTRKSDFEFRQEASLSQKVGAEYPDIQELSGADPKISKKIQRLKWMVRHKLISAEIAKPILEALNGDRLAALATSEKTDIISKLGFMLPAKELRAVDE